MAGHAAQQQQPLDLVQAGMVSSLTSLFSQKINSTEELRKVPAVVKPTPRRKPLAGRQAATSPSHLGYTKVGKPTLIQLVQGGAAHEPQAGQFATEHWTVYETLPVGPEQQQRQPQSHQQVAASAAYVTKKTKYTSRSDASAAPAATAAAAGGASASDKYRLEEWTVYETLPVDMAGAARTADEGRLERIRRQEAEQRRLKAEVEEKKARRQHLEASAVAGAPRAAVGVRKTPEMFTQEEWTVYETVPGERIQRAASSDRETRITRRQQQYQQEQQYQQQQQQRQQYQQQQYHQQKQSQQQQYQQQQHQLVRTESMDSIVGYRRYLDGRDGGALQAAKTSSEETKKTTKISSSAVQRRTDADAARVQIRQSDTRATTRRMDTPELYTKEEWTVYEKVPAAAVVVQETEYQQSYEQQRQQQQLKQQQLQHQQQQQRELQQRKQEQQLLQQQRRSVRWSSTDAAAVSAVAIRKSPEVHSREEWTVYETIPATAVTMDAPQMRHQTRPSQLRRDSERGEESVVGYRRYVQNLPQPQPQNLQLQQRDQQRSSTVVTTRHYETSSKRNLGGSGSGGTREVERRSVPPPPPLTLPPSSQQRHSDVVRSSTPYRTEEWTVVRRVPAGEVPRSGRADGSRRVAMETAWRQQASASPAGYKRYIESTTSLAGEEVTGSRRRRGFHGSGDLESANPFHNGFHVQRDNPIYSGH